MRSSPGFCAALDRRLDVGGEVDLLAGELEAALVGDRRHEELGDPERPLAELADVLVGYADDPAEDVDGRRRRIVRREVGPAVGDEAIDQPVGDLADLVLAHGQRLGGEGASGRACARACAREGPG